MSTLDEILAQANAGDPRALPAKLLAALDDPSRRLAAYGTLRPGQSNHHHVRDLAGPWTAGFVRGRLVVLASGYPALAPAPHAGAGAGSDRSDDVAVAMLESDDLPAAWARLDAFEGPDYRRILIPVSLETGRRIAAYVYVDATAWPPAPPPADP